MFKILHIIECAGSKYYNHIKILFDNGVNKTFCIDKHFRNKYECMIEMYCVINNIFEINHGDNKCSAGAYTFYIDTDKYGFQIYYYENDNCEDKPYCYETHMFNTIFRELPDLVNLLREKHPELLKPVKLAIHEE